MPNATRFAVLGGHLASKSSEAPRDRSDFLDAFDLAVELDDGQTVALGVRTRGYMANHASTPRWADGHVPIETTVEFDSIDHYDFDQVMWLGPEPRPCLAWSNAIGMNQTAIAHLLSDRGNVPTPRAGSRKFRLLEGADGGGLPALQELGLSAEGAAWRDVSDPLS